MSPKHRPAIGATEALVGVAPLVSRWIERLLSAHQPPLTVAQFLALRAIAAEEVSVDRENKGEEEDDRTGADTVDDATPANDDTGYDAEIEDASQL